MSPNTNTDPDPNDVALEVLDEPPNTELGVDTSGRSLKIVFSISSFSSLGLLHMFPLGVLLLLREL